MKSKIDMSPEAVTARLKLASELSTLCLLLGKAKPVLSSDAHCIAPDSSSPKPSKALL